MSDNPESNEFISPAAKPAESNASALQQDYRRWMRQLDEGEEAAATVWAEILAVPLPAIHSAQDAAVWLKASLVGLEKKREPDRLWQIARLLAKRFKEVGEVIGLVANLADLIFLWEGELTETQPTLEEIESLYRRALEIDPHHAANYHYAGIFFARVGNWSAAESCFARASDLNPGWPEPALSLAQIYAEAGRPVDAMELLDLLIGRGCRDPRVLWQAGVNALDGQQWERVITYFTLYLSLDEGHPQFANYFLSLAFLERGRNIEAIAAIEEELHLHPTMEIAAHAVRARACAELGYASEAVDWLEKTLAMPLTQAQALTHREWVRLWKILRDTAARIGRADLLERVEQWADQLPVTSDQ